MEYAGLRGGITELGGQALRGAGYLASRAVAPTAQAAEELAPALTQQAVRGTVQDTSGAATSVRQLLNDPQALANFDVAPGDQLRLLRAWWNRAAASGPDFVAKAWDALGPEGQASVAGDHIGAMQTLVDTIGRAQAPLSLADLTLSGAPATLLRGLGLGSGPGSVAAGLGLAAARRLPPYAMSRALLSPTGSQWLAGLPQMAAAAEPWIQGGLRAGGQALVPSIWPSAPPPSPVTIPGGTMAATTP
jgi:hypothetical protein